MKIGLQFAMPVEFRALPGARDLGRSEERRVGKEC